MLLESVTEVNDRSKIFYMCCLNLYYFVRYFGEEIHDPVLLSSFDLDKMSFVRYCLTLRKLSSDR